MGLYSNEHLNEIEKAGNQQLTSGRGRLDSSSHVARPQQDGSSVSIASRNTSETTTQDTCTCHEFLSKKLPCKHIRKLLKDSGNMDRLLSWCRAFLPPQLQNHPDEVLVEKYVVFVHFITRGVSNGEKILKLAKKASASLLKEKNSLAKDVFIKKMKEAQDDILKAKKNLANRYYIRYTIPVGVMFEELDRLGLIRVIPNEDETLITQKVELPDDIQSYHYEITETYMGVYPPFIRHNVSDSPIVLLEDIQAAKRRGDSILRDAKAEKDHGWAFMVPRCFNSALDIKLTTQVLNGVEYTAWTQGREFTFARGDLIYRNWEDYQKGKAALQVVTAAKADGFVKNPKDTPEDEKKERSPGTVTYDDFSTRTRHTTTQDGFVRILIG